jgi:hypothetical protein
MTTIFVDAIDGVDARTGLSPALAVKTAAAAFAAAMALPLTDDAIIRFKGFSDPLVSYNLTSKLSIYNTNNRTLSNKRIRFEAAEGPIPLITARTRVTGWTDEGNGIISAAVTGPHLTLWHSQYDLREASLYRDMPFSRIGFWEPATKTALIDTYWVPTLASFSGLYMVVQKGWSVSHLRVVNIAPSGFTDISRVTFDNEKEVEFAIADGGLGQSFANGPYHTAEYGKQHFYWYNRPEFLSQSLGTYCFDAVANRVRVKLPFGATLASFEAGGAWVSNNQTYQAIKIDLATVGQFATQVDIEGLAFRHFGNPHVANEGYIGGLSGYGYFNNAGVLGYRQIPPIIDVLFARSILIKGNLFADIAGVGVSLPYAVKDVVVDGNGFCRTASSPIVASGIFPPFDEMPSDLQTDRLWIKNNYFFDVSRTLYGSAIFSGAAAYQIIEHNTIIECPDDGIGFGVGSRVNPSFQLGGVVRFNYIERVMLRATDGGGIYQGGGNQTGIVIKAPVSIHPPHAVLRIYGNYIKDVNKSSLADQAVGNKTAGSYLDLGSNGTLVYRNTFENCGIGLDSTVFKENCVAFATTKDNKLISCGKKIDISYAGFNSVKETSTGTTTKGYLPPVNNPPTADDIDKFNGTGAYPNAFKEVVPFTTPQDCFIGATLEYATTSTFLNNDENVEVPSGPVGAPASVIAKWSQA